MATLPPGITAIHKVAGFYAHDTSFKRRFFNGNSGYY
jgi:hypothetical protein